MEDIIVYLMSPKWNPQTSNSSSSDLIALKRGATITFGKKDDCDVKLTSPSASHHHAELIHDIINNNVVFKDTSSNGSRVNGEKINKTSVCLKIDDTVKIMDAEWQVMKPEEIDMLIKGAKGQGKIKNSTVGEVVNRNQKEEAEKEKEKTNEKSGNNKKGGVIATPLSKIVSMFSPRRSSSAMNKSAANETIEEDEDMNMNNSPEIRERGAKSPKVARSEHSFEVDLENDLQHQAKRQPSTKYVNISTIEGNFSSPSSEKYNRTFQEEKNDERVAPAEVASSAALTVSSNKKIQEIYSSVLEAHSHKDVPTLENLTTDTIHSVIKCAADANEAFHNELSLVMEKNSNGTDQFSEATALFEAVAQGKAFPFASSKILKERVRYCAQLEERLREHQAVYDQLLQSRELMAQKLESVRISCGVARSIVAEYQNLYESVYNRINAEIPRPVLEHGEPTPLKLHKIVLSPEEVKEITDAMNIRVDAINEPAQGVQASADAE